MSETRKNAVCGLSPDDGELHPLNVKPDGTLRTDVGSISATVDITGDHADLDSGAGTDEHEVFAIGLPADGGHVVGGTDTNPLKVRDPNIPVARGNVFTVHANNISLADGGSTGILAVGDDCEHYRFWRFSAFTDQPGTITVQYSIDGITWRTLETISIAANTHVNKMYQVTRRYYRVYLTDKVDGNAPTSVDLVSVRSTGG